MSEQKTENRNKNPKEAVLVINTSSKSGRRLFFETSDILTEKGINLTASYPVRDPARLPEIVKEVVDQKQKLVIVGGGDGTISSIVDTLAYKNTILGILPLGTANSFARSLNIPLNLTEAIDVIANGKVTAIDLGKINEDYFANTANIGLTSKISRLVNTTDKRRFGRFAYLLPLFGQLITHKQFSAELKFEDKTEVLNCLEILIANGQFQGGVKLAPDAELNSGKLEILAILAENNNKWNLVKFWIKSILNQNTTNSPVSKFTTSQEVIISTKPKMYVDIDGETTVQTPVSVSVASKALKIMVP